VVCANPGPTCKSDCLNWVYQGIREFEQATGARFAVFLVHDAEDLPHRLSLKIFNALMPPYDLAQLPVLSLPSPWRQFTAATTSTNSPSCTSRTSRAAMAHAEHSRRRRGLRVQPARARDDRRRLGQQVFNVDSLTEDYELGLKLAVTGCGACS